jgi:uncharacterized protein (DUF58 family)
MTIIPQQSSIQNLELIAKQVVEGFIIGLHKSPFHGFSVEFAEHRLYNSGDNLKYVDWKVFGRSDKMFVKKFEEETNLRCCIAIDTSASMFYPEQGTTKLQYSTVAAACLLQLLKKQLDASALAYFDESVYSLTGVRSGTRHYGMLMSQLEQLLHTPNTQKRTYTAAALHELADRLHQRSLVIIFSDMADNQEQTADLLAALQHLKYNKHEVILFHVVDGAKELDFDFENRPYEFVDMETQEVIKLNPMDVKESYLTQAKARHQELKNQCLQAHIDMITCDMRAPVEAVLHSYLLKRNKMM